MSETGGGNIPHQQQQLQNIQNQQNLQQQQPSFMSEIPGIQNIPMDMPSFYPGMPPMGMGFPPVGPPFPQQPNGLDGKLNSSVLIEGGGIQGYKSKKGFIYAFLDS